MRRIGVTGAIFSRLAKLLDGVGGTRMRLVLGVAIALLALPAGVQAVVPVAGTPPPFSVVTINDSPGQQFDPHVSGNLAAYTNNAGGSHIHFYNFTTGVDTQIANTLVGGGTSLDLLPDASGSKVIFARQVGGTSRIMVFDTATSTLTEVDPASTPLRLGSAIGGDTVAYVDFDGGSGYTDVWGNTGSGDIIAWNLSSQTRQVVSNSPDFEQNPNVSPDGQVIVWESCPNSLVNCDIRQAVLTAGAWVVSIAANSLDPEGDPDTNGQIVVYSADRAGSATGQDIYYHPVSGGTEVQIELPGTQRNPSIAGNYIGFESIAPGDIFADFFVYDLVSNQLFQITSTPAVNETLNDITLLANNTLHLVWSSNDQDVVGATIDMPPSDTTPPAITYTVTGTLGSNGWYTGNVGLTWQVSESESAATLVKTGCIDQSIATDQSPTNYACAASSLGGSAGPVTVAIKRDATAPTLTFSGNAGTYTVTQSIAIGCVANDSLSGIATGCSGVSASAYTFPLGANSVTRSAADNAGNIGTRTTTFTVMVNSSSLCALTGQFVRGSVRYQALNPVAKWVVDAAVSTACVFLTGIGPQTLPAQKAKFIRGYLDLLQTLATTGWLTQAQVTTLATLVATL